jgi:hypothetical protein
MLRRNLLVLCLLTALLATFGAGAVVAVTMNWGKPLATVTVENHSGKTIAAVEMLVSTCGTERTLLQKSADIKAFANPATAYRFTLPLCGEGGHRTKVWFSDGMTVQSPGSYIMKGTRIVERVQRDSIQSEITSFPY